MTTRGALRCTSSGSATSLLGGRDPSGPVFWHGPRRYGRRTTPIRRQGLSRDCVLRSDRWPRSSLRCRKPHSKATNYRAARPSGPRRRRRTRPWPGCPAPCSIKGVEVAWRLARLLTPANPVLVCVEIKFRTPHAIDATLSPSAPSSLVDFHTGSRAVREIRPGDLPGFSLHQSRVNATTTGAAVAAIAGAERRASTT
jgi:hypothetical protein